MESIGGDEEVTLDVAWHHNWFLSIAPHRSFTTPEGPNTTPFGVS